MVVGLPGVVLVTNLQKVLMCCLERINRPMARYLAADTKRSLPCKQISAETIQRLVSFPLHSVLSCFVQLYAFPFLLDFLWPSCSSSSFFLAFMQNIV